MMQLVGQNCVRCGERIPNDLEARFCQTCGSPVHDRCARPSGEAGCPVCGASVSQAQLDQHNPPVEEWQLLSPDTVEALSQYVAGQLRRGVDLGTVRMELIARGMRPNSADQFLARFAPGKWERGLRGFSLRGLGVLLMLAGGFLIAGNRIGFFPTFPFAGALVLLLGAFVLAVGGGKVE